MIRPFVKSVALIFVVLTSLLADFSYEQTSRVTGGTMASMMRFAGKFSKKAAEPIKTTFAIKGDRMATVWTDHATIIDLAKETVTEVNFEKKTYSVMTFAEMKRLLDQAARSLDKNGQGDMQFKISVKETGQSKQVAGVSAKEVILQMEMEAKDKESGQKGGMVITSDMWMATQVPGYEEMAAFHKRMAGKLNWNPSGGLAMMMRPELKNLQNEAQKLEGMPVYQVVKMGAAGQPGQQAAGNGAAPAQQPQQQQQQQQEVEKPSVGDALGGALGGRLGGFGGFGRRKKPKQEQPAEPAPQQQQQQQQAPPADASGTLMEMTMEVSGFSSSVNPSHFEVPAGFKQVEPDKNMR